MYPNPETQNARITTIVRSGSYELCHDSSKGPCMEQLQWIDVCR